MSSNILDQLPEEDLVRRIKDLEAIVQAMRTPQKQGSDVVRITRSGVIPQSAIVTANSGGYMGVSPINGDGKPTFNVLESLYYQDTDNDSASEIGSSLNNFRDYWDLELSRDISTDTTRCDFTLYYFNHDTADHTLYWHAQARYVLNNT